MWSLTIVSDQCEVCYCSNPEQVLFSLEWRQWWFLIESSAILFHMHMTFWVSLHRPTLKKYAPNSLQMSSGCIMQTSHSMVNVVQSAWGSEQAELVSSRRLLDAGEALSSSQTLQPTGYALWLWLSFLNSITGDYIWLSFELKSSWLFLHSLSLPTFADHFSSPMTSVLASLILFPSSRAGFSALWRRDYL